MCVFPLGKFTFFYSTKIAKLKKGKSPPRQGAVFSRCHFANSQGRDTHTHTHIKAPRDHSVGFFTYFVPASCMYETWCVVLMKTCKESPHPFKTTSWKCIGVCCHKPPDRCCRSKKKSTEAASELAATQVSNLKRIAAERGKEGVAQGWLKFS